MRKIPFAGIELTFQRVRGLRGTSELPGRPCILYYLYHIICYCTIATSLLFPKISNVLPGPNNNYCKHTINMKWRACHSHCATSINSVYELLRTQGLLKREVLELSPPPPPPLPRWIDSLQIRVFQRKLEGNREDYTILEEIRVY